jgi:DNA (cytosine-5)-methyltransferase 1
MKSSDLTITDQFCGAGGSSQGARRVSSRIPGVRVKLAMNHWKLAIETHNTNFPDTIHDCTDISACDPRRYPSTNILITSPECTNHTLAKGVKRFSSQMDLFNSGKLDPSAERSRATMWDVPRFAEYHNYEVIIVENVVDAREWVMYPAWLNAMHLLGYRHKAVYMNSMFCHPTPQSRDRLYVVFWKKGNREPMLDFMPTAWCPKCEKDIQSIQRWKNPQKQFGKYRKQYTYVCPVCATEVMPYFYAAFNCIDWSDIGTRIGDRNKPLSENTMKRIEYGLNKYGTQSLYLKPFVINDQQSTGIGFRVNGVEDRLPTLTSTHQLKIVMPFIMKEEHTRHMDYMRSMNDPLMTHSTRQSMALITPFMVESKGQSNVRKITDPFSTITSIPYHGIVTDESWRSFLTYYYGKSQASAMNEPAGTIRANDGIALVSHDTPLIEDCYFRMLRPDEIKLAMAFDRDYIILGSQKDQVKQCGNAVTPPVMEWLVERAVESLQ